MDPLHRRSFLTLSSRFAAVLGLGGAAVPTLSLALEEAAAGNAPVLWLQGQSCSGCSVSLLNSDTLSPLTLLTRHICLQFHQTLASATGHQAVQAVNLAIERGGFVLLVEGSVPAKMPSACVFGEEAFADQLTRAARRAKAVVALGTCASFGGIPAAERNPTGATGIAAFLRAQNITTPTVNIPGCPFHPDWLVGTVVHLLKFGLPRLDTLGRPEAFFSRLLHDQCPRFADYERENFAKAFGEDGCLFKLGCLGVLTRSDCNLRSFNSVSSCIRAGAPCIGCAGEGFAARADLAFVTKNRARSAAQ